MKEPHPNSREARDQQMIATTNIILALSRRLTADELEDVAAEIRMLGNHFLYGIISTALLDSAKYRREDGDR
jgi:hypothetical protein